MRDALVTLRLRRDRDVGDAEGRRSQHETGRAARQHETGRAARLVATEMAILRSSNRRRCPAGTTRPSIAGSRPNVSVECPTGLLAAVRCALVKGRRCGSAFVTVYRQKRHTTPLSRVPFTATRY